MRASSGCLLRERQIRGQYDTVPVEPRLDRLWPDAALPPLSAQAAKRGKEGHSATFRGFLPLQAVAHGNKPV